MKRSDLFKNMSRKVFYIVNSDSTTSIPLEVAGVIKKEHDNFHVYVYYSGTPNKPNKFIKEITNIGALSFFDIKAIFKSLKLIKKEKPDVIHAHHTWSSIIFFLFAKLFSPSTRLIKTEHNNHKYFKWYQKFLNFFIILFADQILCNSGSTMDSFSFIEKKISHGKTQICYNGVNINLINNINESQNNKQPSNEKKEIIIGSVGRFIKQKDYPTLINAFEQVSAKASLNIKLLLIGDGKDRIKLEQLVKKKKLDHLVIFTGVIDREKVFSYLNEIDIFVMTSLWEGFCNTLVEALAARKAIVCSDIPTLKEVGGNAVLFARPNDPKSFAQAITMLLNNNSLFQDLSQKAEERANFFTLDACAKRYMSHYY